MEAEELKQSINKQTSDIMDDYYTKFKNFVTEGRFVSPEKIEAVNVFGLEKAMEMFADGKQPDFQILDNLRRMSCERSFLFHKELNTARQMQELQTNLNRYQS